MVTNATNDMLLNVSDCLCTLPIVHDSESSSFVPHPTLGGSDVILGGGMIVIFSVDYVDILIFSRHFTSCMYVLFVF